tara:strand:+ start:1233 stop:1595 length:363 start_codon:yes stop_codon:yes gene_type:complete
MMDELLEKLKMSPPETPDELESMLDETGYELLAKEPGTDVPGEADEEEVEEEAPEEAPEDMGPEEGPEGEADEGIDMLREMAGAPVGAGDSGMSPRMKLRVTTIKAAKNAVDKDKKQKSK